MTMITPSYLGETIEYSSLHACRSTLEDPTNADGLKGELPDATSKYSSAMDPSAMVLFHLNSFLLKLNRDIQWQMACKKMRLDLAKVIVMMSDASMVQVA